MSPDAVAAHDGVMSQVARVADDIGVVTQVAVVAVVSVMSVSVILLHVFSERCVFSNSCCNCTGLFIASVTMYSCRSH